VAITFVGEGADVAAASGAINAALPAGTQENDILVIVAGTYAHDTLAATGYTLKAAYTQVISYNQGKVHVFWKRHDGSESDPIEITGASNSVTANVLAFRGVDTGADPWDVWDAAKVNEWDTSVAFPALTTMTDGAMVIGAVGVRDDETLSDFTYGNLSAPTGNGQHKTNSGNDCAHAYLYGLMSAAGDIGSPAATMGASDGWVSCIGALKPLVVPSATGYMNLRRGIW